MQKKTARLRGDRESEIAGRNAPETVRDRKEKEEKASISRNDRRNECEDQKEGLHTML
jgi:hypothetical protein